MTEFGYKVKFPPNATICHDCVYQIWSFLILELTFYAIYISMSVNGPLRPPSCLCLPLSVSFLHPVRCCKSGSSYDDVKVELKGVHSHFEDVKLERNPAYGEVSPSKAPTEPQPYEEFVAIGGVISGGDVGGEPCLSVS